MSRRICLVIAFGLLLLVAAACYWFDQLDLSALEYYGIDPETLRPTHTFYFVMLPVIAASILLADRTSAVPPSRKCRWVIGSVLLFPLVTIALLYRIARHRGDEPNSG
jgi:hypothetical protein